MPVTIVVGGQYGSEGKGKVVYLLARDMEAPFVVRCGGPNSGHTTVFRGKDVILRQVPAAPEHPGATFCLSAGCAIDQQILLQELDMLAISRDRIFVDPRAVLITQEDKELEAKTISGIASTCSGTGHALARRMSRSGKPLLANDSPEIQSRCRVETVAPLLHAHVKSGGNVIVEGTQGFGLSLLHSAHYPNVTSRDTTAAAFAMEAGLSPRCIDQVVMVVRTFPIRVGGISGPLDKEISWQDVQQRSAAPDPRVEYTSVTKRIRRVAEFDFEAVRIACAYNGPTSLAVMGLDRLNHENSGMASYDDLSYDAKSFLADLVQATECPVEFIGTGFGTKDAIRMQIKAQTWEIVNA